MRTNLRSLALICFILPISIVVISYIASIKLNLVEACMPNLEGCTSISRTGRYVPVKYFFKPMMYIYSVFLFLFWFNLQKKLIKLKFSKKKFLWIANFSVIFLILYVTFLGEGKTYELFRRIGIYVYIFFTVLVQFLISKNLYSIKNKIKKIYNIKFIRINYYLTSLLIIFGIFLLPILVLKIENFPQIKNIISWNYFLLIQLYFLFYFLSQKKFNNH